MKARRILPSLLPATLVPVFGALIVAGLACSGAPQPDDSGIRDPKEQDAKPGKSDTLPSWPMLGGTPGRNMANAVDKNLPSEWSAQKNAHKNIKWVAKLGSYAYGGPAIAGGRVFVGTNNDNPRDPKIKGDKGVLMCFRESDGEFLWQSVHDKLPNPMANDWPQQGIASTPAVDGDRLYYVSNRCELVCADVAGDADKKTAKIIWRLDMMQDLGVYPNSLAN